MREEVVDDGIEELGREYRGGRIGISVEIVEVSEGVACDAGSEALDREGSNDNSENVEREGSTVGVTLERKIVERSVATSSRRTLIFSSCFELFLFLILREFSRAKIREKCTSLIDFRAAAWVCSILSILSFVEFLTSLRDCRFFFASSKRLASVSSFSFNLVLDFM